jgi:2-methylcitrate dehydratase PrpD
VIAQALAKHIIKSDFNNLSDEVREVTKRSILDTLGVMLPSTTMEKACLTIYKMAKEFGGKRESTIVGFGGKAPCETAAFVNGSLTHSLDYDDSVLAGNRPLIHPTGSTLPAALAVAERVGKVSGKEFITAIALGNDLGVRMASCVKGNLMEDFSFFPVTIFGVFSAAAAAGKILGLSEGEMINALGLAAHRVAGVRESMMAIDSDLRAIRDAFTNREGVFSALMASRGIAASKNAIEQTLLAYYRGEYDPEPLTAGLGRLFRGVEARFKLWPTCGQTHGHIQAVMRIIKEHDIKPEQIDEVVLTGSKFYEALCVPVKAKRHPALSIAARYSLPFVIAVVLTKGNIRLTHFLPENLSDTEVIAVADKVKFVVEPACVDYLPIRAEIKTKGKHGQIYLTVVNRDNSSTELNLEGIIDKFKDCASYSKKHLSQGKIQRIITGILHLEKVDDISEIIDILA